MKYKELSESKIQVSEIGLGCMSLSPESNSSKSVIEAAISGGISFLDTADLYSQGWNEKAVGQAIKSVRSQVILATKVGNELRADGSGWDWNPKKSYILKAVEDSLSRLQTDYIDLYQLHGGTIEDPWDETLEAFEILKAQGKIRAFGISSIRPNVIREVLSKSNPATIMMQYNPLDRRPEEIAFPAIEKSSAKVLVRGAFVKGLLIDKTPKSFLNYDANQVKRFQDFVNDQDFSPEAFLIRFGLAQPVVASLVIGASSVAQVEKMVAGYGQSQVIPEETLKLFQQKFPVNHYDSHR
ncbi:MAG: aldo/keto reductase [Algoriphagus sp.]|uniref:aldo/keto reductase n=1 Tax=Algoriphagus sp. TaxID=1872435 RepID=UPI00260A7708|nr:aldo/keto reductase [Algoriphagus sp.]MDG1277373.1 aldo/keto reductase [Algoriphagus sp.]